MQRLALEAPSCQYGTTAPTPVADWQNRCPTWLQGLARLRLVKWVYLAKYRLEEGRSRVICSAPNPAHKHRKTVPVTALCWVGSWQGCESKVSTLRQAGP